MFSENTYGTEVMSYLLSVCVCLRVCLPGIRDFSNKGIYTFYKYFIGRSKGFRSTLMRIK